MILIDLQKASDTQDHDILLGKMNYFDFTSETIDWFGSYLKKMKHCNSFRNRNFELWCTSRQGSILGPILYLLYVNDIKTALKNCDLRLYADVTRVYFITTKVSS